MVGKIECLGFFIASGDPLSVSCDPHGGPDPKIETHSFIKTLHSLSRDVHCQQDFSLCAKNVFISDVHFILDDLLTSSVNKHELQPHRLKSSVLDSCRV